MQLSRKSFYIIAIVTSLLYAFSIFNFSYIFEQNAYWKEPFADRITNHIGLLYFIQDNWRWPLFYVPQLAFPEGANIIYTDSIPLLALITKIFYKSTGIWFNYFGFWVFACFPLLGLFAALAIREGRCKDPVAIVGGILLALSSPALLVRFGHIALMGHFLIVWAFFIYLKFCNTSSVKNLTIHFVIITSLCILLQTYFLLMVMPFFAAALLQAFFERRIKLFSAALSSAIVFSSILLIAFISGMIGPGSVKGTSWGFGYYSMNLLSPFIPPRAHLPAFIAQHIKYDPTGYSWDATGGQYEGYNYLGAGVLFLLFIQLTAFFPLAKQIIKKHLFLIFALACLTLLALSNQIYLGNRLIFSTHDRHWLDFFRTSGRLFWPIYYVLMIALVLGIFKRFSIKTARSIIFIAVIAQLLDTTLLRTNMIAAISNGYPQVLNNKAWNELLAEHQFVEQYPSFQCGGWAKDWPDNNSNMEFLTLAAKQNKPINSAYLARTSRSCIDETADKVNVKLKNGGLYIFAKDFPMREFKESNDFQKSCREFNFGYVCTNNSAALKQLATYTEFKIPAKASIPSYNLGETLHFISNGNGDSFLHNGWYPAETWGTWSKGKDSDITLKISHPENTNYLMTVYARGFVHPKRPEKQIDVYVDGKKIATWKYKLGEEVTKNSAAIPRNFLNDDDVIKIKFVSDVAESPKQAKLSEDTKEISLGLIELSISPIQNS